MPDTPNNYCTVADIQAIKPLTASQREQAEVLITQASAQLRTIARGYGKDIDAMIADPISGADYALTVKSVVVNTVIRALDSVASEQSQTISSASETLGPYSYTYHYLNAGAALYYTNNDLKLLNLNNQIYGALELY